MGVISRKRTTAAGIGMLVAAALALTGCSGGSGTSSDGGSGSSKHLTVWFPGNDPNESKYVEQTMVPKFEKETGAKVDVTFVDYTNLSPKLNAAFAAGSAPDVFGHGAAAVADFVKNDRIEPLDDDVAKLSASDRKDLADALAGAKVDGKQYMIPLQMQGWLLMYNKKDFTEAGLDPATPPTTWEDVKADAEKLTKRDGSGKITRSGLLLQTEATGRQQSFATLIASAGGSQLNTKGTKASFDSAAGVKALQYFVSLYQGSDAVAANLGQDYLNQPTAQQPLVTGDAAMTIQTAQGASKIAAAYPDGDWGIIQPPKFEGQSEGYAFGGSGPGMMINKDSKNKTLAWKFIEFMIDPANYNGYIKTIGGVPNRSSALSTPYVKDSPVLGAWLKASGQWVPNPNVPNWVQARDTLDKYLEQALNKVVTPKQALKQAASQVDGILSANG